MATFVLIHGTNSRGAEWFRRESPLTRTLIDRGHRVLMPFTWSGQLGGVFRRTHDDPMSVFDDRALMPWGSEAEHLLTHVRFHAQGEPVSICAHSHGGGIAVLAIAQGLIHVRDLVTLATPVRGDLEPFYRHVLPQITGAWTHLHGDAWRDWMMRLGGLRDGHFGWRMAMPDATTNIHVPGTGHAPQPLADAWLARTAGETK